jgi:biuret amidohydrolase
MRARVPFKNLMAPVPPANLAAEPTALLLLDCHRFTLDPELGFGRLARERGISRELAEYYEQVEIVLPNLRTLLGACRRKSLPIFFTRLVREGKGEGPGARQTAVTGFWSAPDSADAAFLSDLGPRQGDAVLDRTTVSAFAGTNLAERLGSFRIRSVLVAGAPAGGPVDLTAREAADLGYNVVVVSDACAAETWTLHSLTMTLLVGGLIRVRTVEAVLEMLDGRRT